LLGVTVSGQKNWKEERIAPLLLWFPTEQLGHGLWMISPHFFPSADSSDLTTSYLGLPSSPSSPDGLTPQKLTNQTAGHKLPSPWTTFRSPLQSYGTNGATGRPTQAGGWAQARDGFPPAPLRILPTLLFPHHLLKLCLLPSSPVQFDSATKPSPAVTPVY